MVVRRRAKTRREVSEGIIAYLKFGTDFFGEAPEEWPRFGAIPDDVYEEMRLAWEQCGEQVTEEYERSNQGRKPWGWWHFESGQRIPQETGWEEIPQDRS